jgi:serine/threonine protein kinase
MRCRSGGNEIDEKSALENIEAGRIRFSELTLGSLLGSGSFADVYRAEWRMPCAVKKMKGRISKEQMTEFVREGEMMRTLKHPGIVKLLGVCVEGEFPFSHTRFQDYFLHDVHVFTHSLCGTWFLSGAYVMSREIY